MSHSLIIRLPHNANNPVNWIRVDSQGQLVDSEIQVSLNQIPTAKHTVYVLILGTDVVLTQVDIPSKQWQRIVQAVPYALEEQLAEEIENLHFALGKRDTTGNIAVAIMARNQLEIYLQQLTTAHLTPTLFMPDILAVPQPEQGWGILYFDSIVLVRTGLQAGFAIELSCLEIALQIALVEHQANPPTQLVIFTNDHTRNLLPDLPSLGIPVIEQIYDGDTLAWLAPKILENNSPLNLLQGDYCPQNKIAHLWRPWRLTAILLVLWVGLQIMKQILEYQQLTQQRQALNTQIETIYRETFPKARKIVNPQVQMEQQLKALRDQYHQDTPNKHFLELLNQLSTPLQRTPGFNLQRINYQQEQFELHLEVANLEALEYLKQRLNRLGFTVEIQSATSRNQRIESRLRIKYES